MPELYDDEMLAAASAAYDTADGDWSSHQESLAAAVHAIAPLIAAKALRDETARTYTHTFIAQGGERQRSQRPVWPERDRTILLERADEIEGVDR